MDRQISPIQINQQRLSTTTVIANQSSDWCGDPHPQQGEALCVPKAHRRPFGSCRSMSDKENGLPRQCAHWLAMTSKFAFAFHVIRTFESTMVCKDSILKVVQYITPWGAKRIPRLIRRLSNETLNTPYWGSVHHTLSILSVQVPIVKHKCTNLSILSPGIRQVEQILIFDPL